MGFSIVTTVVKQQECPVTMEASFRVDSMTHMRLASSVIRVPKYLEFSTFCICFYHKLHWE